MERCVPIAVLEVHLFLSNFHVGTPTDHYGTFSKMNDIVFDDPNSTDVYYRRTTLSDPEWQEFNAELDSSLQHIYSDFVSHNPDNLANVITKTYRFLIDKYMSLKKLSNKRKRNSDKPWIPNSRFEKKCME